MVTHPLLQVVVLLAPTDQSGMSLVCSDELAMAVWAPIRRSKAAVRAMASADAREKVHVSFTAGPPFLWPCLSAVMRLFCYAIVFFLPCLSFAVVLFTVLLPPFALSAARLCTPSVYLSGKTRQVDGGAFPFPQIGIE
jgi:hypothetical protein